MSSDNLVCGSCIQEVYLSAKINASGVLGECNYCRKRRLTFTIARIAEQASWVIDTYYRATNDDDRVVIYEYDPAGQQLDDLIEELVPAGEEVREHLIEAVEEQWFDHDSMQKAYGNDPYFDLKGDSPLPSNYSKEWRRMEQSLTQEARHFNPTAAEVLERVFGPVMNDRTVVGTEVIAEIGPNNRLDSLFRARVFQSLESLESALISPAEEIGPPPTSVARQGRMNARGISVFYGSTVAQMALAEVRPPVGSYVALGRFDLVRPLKVLDLVRLQQLTNNASLFDPATQEVIGRQAFLKTLAMRMVMPVMPEHEDGGYLITQVIADFLASHPKLNLDGIMFSSAQYKAGGDDDRNVTLFHKAGRVGSTNLSIAEVQLMEFDEDGERWAPTIVLKRASEAGETLAPTSRPRLSKRRDEDGRPVSLELDVRSLKISEVQFATYKVNATGVSVWEPPSGKKKF